MQMIRLSPLFMMRFVLLISLVTIGARQLLGAEPASRELNSGWEFRALGNTYRADIRDWHPAQVPGVVQTDLLRAALIPDPYYQDNESGLQWIGNTDWEYRTSFQVDSSTLCHEHVDMVFDGLDTFADVYLNDRSVLKANNMFRRWRIPAKGLLKPGSNNLRVVFHSPIQQMLAYVRKLPYILPAISTINGGNEESIPTAPYTRKAPYQYGWDWGPRFVTEGIWQPIRLEIWDTVRIENFHIHQQKISIDAASVSAELEIEASRNINASVTYSHDNLSGSSANDGAQTVHLDPGINRIAYALRITSPKLWYPLGYGAQDRYHFAASIRIGRELAAHADVKTGLRSIELRRASDQWGKSFTFLINGIPVFAKGANVIPFDSFPPRETKAQHRLILESARDAHMNMVREWGGGFYEYDDFYEICDELGILVWQEFSFGGDMVPGDVPFQDNVRAEAIDQIKRLRDHPSIVVWCGNNEIETGWYHWGDRQEFKEAISPAARDQVWKDYIILFADILKSTVTEYADPVPYWPSSPSANWEEIPDNDHNGDTHYWQVWHAQAPAEDYLKQLPRFMTEFGFQSFPEMRTIRAFATPGDLDIRSAVMQAHQKNKGGNERILTYMLREYREPKDFASFVYLSQVQQAEIIKLGAEHLRRQRPRTMGSLYWQLNDCWPVASWASIDYFGRWKALQYYARRFYDDLLISPYRHEGKIDVYVVSDKLQPFAATVHVRLLDFAGRSALEQNQEIKVPALSSASYLTLDERSLLSKADPRRSFVVVDLAVNGKQVSRNLVFFEHMHHLDLPDPVPIQKELRRSGNSYVLELQSPVLARNVNVSFGDLDTQLSDDYYDLLPNEPVTVTVKSSATLEQLRGAMNIRSLTDSFGRNLEIIGHD